MAVYVLTGISLWVLWDRAGTAADRRRAIRLLCAHLILSTSWIVVFFVFQTTWGGLALIVAAMMIFPALFLAAARVSRFAAWLLVPTFLWSLGVAVLNTSIAVLNS
jgi:tryptophan-rich sensory protein